MSAQPCDDTYPGCPECWPPDSISASKPTAAALPHITEASAERILAGLAALCLLPSLIRAMEDAAAVLPDDLRPALYAEAWRAKALLSETS